MLTTTGAIMKDQLLARELMLQSFHDDQAGLKLYFEEERLKMTHTAAVITAIKED